MSSAAVEGVQVIAVAAVAVVAAADCVPSVTVIVVPFCTIVEGVPVAPNVMLLVDYFLPPRLIAEPVTGPRLICVELAALKIATVSFAPPPLFSWTTTLVDAPFHDVDGMTL